MKSSHSEDKLNVRLGSDRIERTYEPDFETDEADVKEAIEDLLNKLYYSKN
jgi:hypothetical protein